MSRQTGSQERTFGYLSTVESAEHGYFGGYLVLSALGRPLEFHCTAPIRPSRAQRILYGPTLEPYLLGEQICGALLGVAKLTPSVVLTDCPAALHARARFAVPLALLLAAADTASHASVVEPQPCRSDASSGNVFTVGTNQLQLPVGYERDERDVVEAITQFAQQVELAEPFARIQDAIREAQRIGGRGTEAHDHAA